MFAASASPFRIDEMPQQPSHHQQQHGSDGLYSSQAVIRDDGVGW